MQDIIIYGYNLYPKTYTEANSKKSGLALYNTFQVFGFKEIYNLTVSFIRSSFDEKEKLYDEIIDGITVYNMPVKFSEYFEPNGTFDASLPNKFYQNSISLENPIYFSLCNNLQQIINSQQSSSIIINTHNFIPTTVAVLAQQQSANKNARIYATIHDIDRNLAIFVKENQQFVERLIAISKSVKERLISIGFAEEKIVLIPNGIDFKPIYSSLEYCQSNNVWEQICHEYAIEKSSFILTLPARRVPHKGHSVAFNALRQIIDQNNSDIKLLITGCSMGQEWYEKELRELISKLRLDKNVILLNELEQEEMVSLYDNSDLIITPSTVEEGFCYANIECMLVGKAAVVTSNFGGVLDYMKHMETGYLVPVGDYAALAESIDFLLRNNELRESIIQNAKKVAELYDEKRMLSSYFELFSNHEDK